MDLSSSSSLQSPQLDISKLSDKDKAELQQFIVNESQKARIQQCTSPTPSSLLLFSPSAYLLTTTPADATWAEKAVHALTDICWRKCVTGRISSGNLDRGEENCTANCVDRFMDANMTVLKHLEELRGQGGV